MNRRRPRPNRPALGLRAAYVAVADIGNGAGIPAERGRGTAAPARGLPRSREYLLLNQPRWGTCSGRSGHPQIEQIAATGTRPAYTRQSVAYEDFAELIDDPLAFFRNAYQWGTSDFRGEEFPAPSRTSPRRGISTPNAWRSIPTLAQLIQGALSPATAVDTVLRFPW